MIVTTLMLAFLALLSWLLLRFGLKQATTTIAQARIVVFAVVMSLMTIILTLVLRGLTVDQQIMASLTPIRSTEAMATADDQRIVLIEGRISEQMDTRRDSYVAYLRTERGDNSRSTFDYPSRFQVDLTEYGTVEVDTYFTSQGDDIRPGYHNWPSHSEGFYTYYYLQRGTPVVVLGT
ncbi:MAG: hypothetical protein AAF639_14125, partial [Chloroflexota bacterium]